MKLITVHIPEAYLTALDQLIANDVYPNRSEAIRVAIRDLIRNELGTLMKLGSPNMEMPELVK